MSSRIPLEEAACCLRVLHALAIKDELEAKLKEMVRKRTKGAEDAYEEDQKKVRDQTEAMMRWSGLSSEEREWEAMKCTHLEVAQRRSIEEMASKGRRKNGGGSPSTNQPTTYEHNVMGKFICLASLGKIPYPHSVSKTAA